MRLRTLVLVTVVATGALGFASDAFAQRHRGRDSGRYSSRTYRPAPRYYGNNRYSRPYSYSYSYRPYSYGYRPFVHGYSYDPYYYAPYYYEPYYYATPPYVPPYVRYRGYSRPRVGIRLHLGW